MKIRCETNSIRLRLRKSELVQLRAEKWLEAAVHFPDRRAFVWELVLHDSSPEIDAHFAEGRIQVRVPEAIARQWIESNTVSLERFLPLPDGHVLHILIEKDFPCKDRPDEDKTDFFTELADEAPVNC
jgi:hypothetical protein